MIAVTSLRQMNELIKTHKFVVVKWGAEWCAPCKAVEPMYKKLAKEYPDLCLVTVDVDVFTGAGLKDMGEGVRGIPLFTTHTPEGVTNRVFGIGKISAICAKQMSKA